MELCLHIGTNKTGSSFLQTTMTANKHSLLAESIFVPDSKWDQKMFSGIITPGNGHEMTVLLAGLDRKKLIKYLCKVIEKAKQTSSKKVILSNEILIRLFSSEKHLKLLYESAIESGFEKIKCLCFLRNPYDHALSLYKHRSKNGKHNDYEKWFKNDYETLKLFSKYLCFYDKYPFEWIFRIYKKESIYLIKCLFYDFLECSLSVNSISSIQVNQSYSLNTIKIIQFLETNYPRISHKLHKYIDLSSIESDENQYLFNKFMLTAYNYFKDYETLLINISKLLSEDETRLYLHKPIFEEQIKDKYTLKVTESEYLLINDLIKKYKDNYFYILFSNQISILVKYTRKFISKNKFSNKEFGGYLR